MILTLHFTIFCRYYCRHDVKVDAILFYYISGVLTEHKFENLHGFYSYKFYTDKWKNNYSLQECSIITWSAKLLLTFKKSIATACHLFSPWKPRQSWKKHLQTFSLFSTIFLHRKWNWTRLLSPESECTSCLTSCRTT